ncbi:small ribosomal subunit Rsm22 family protein [Streptomyces oceani]|uniref:rRNA methyltransferase n=1 Tax=Streptomyces oceani TaxID=1075402 RepID=A0A1E7KF06_9ACTN|nr:small ribosomal subunit Rsm22 family protein [Streptomyces oceani]OEV02498.1 rRNA methyltransferase [Streptomyces oceani]
MHQPSAPSTDQQLRTALAAQLDGLPPRQATTAVERLIAHYRGDTPTHTPVLRDRADVVAYAAYRMPATFAAVAAALAALARRLPGWAPASHLDLGGGTGAAAWAAELTWGDPPPAGAVRQPATAEPGRTGGQPARTTTVLDWAEPALELGRELVDRSAAPALRDTLWRPGRLPGPRPDAVPDTFDLVTVSYVLGELTPEDRAALVADAARTGRVVVLVEPGTPDGYLRVREARDALVRAGLRVLAPCPHSARCPITPGEDWCHFSERVSRSSLHRQVKGGSLAYEDEKFSYVAAARPRVGGVAATTRIVRKPQLRKGQVLLDLCGEDDGLSRSTVSKRRGADYRAARAARWGDSWPPEPEPEP